MPKKSFFDHFEWFESQIKLIIDNKKKINVRTFDSAKTCYYNCLNFGFISQTKYNNLMTDLNKTI